MSEPPAGRRTPESPVRIRASWAAYRRSLMRQLPVLGACAAGLVLLLVLGPPGARGPALAGGLVLTVALVAAAVRFRGTRVELHADHLEAGSPGRSRRVRLQDVRRCVYVARMPGTTFVASHPACGLMDGSGRALLWASGQMIAEGDLQRIVAWASRTTPVDRFASPTAAELSARYPALFRDPAEVPAWRRRLRWLGLGLVVGALAIMAARALS